MKRGKFERIGPKPQKKARAGLLQTYIFGILCLTLCCAMFLSTTFAWFTSDFTSSGNQIYIGVLEATLWHKADGSADYNQITPQGNEHVFSKDKVWEPGASTEEVLKIKNSGDIAFRYTLQLLAGGQNTLTQEQLMAAAQWFEVSYRESGEAEWTDVTAEGGEKATLAQVLQQGIPVLAGELAGGSEAVWELRLAMKANADLSQIQGQTLLMDVRLVAVQLAQPHSQGQTADPEENG